MTKLVKQILAKKAENKVIGNNIEVAVQHNSGIAPADCLPIVPQITNGDDSFQRLGDRISPKSLRVKGVLSIAPADALGLQKDIYARVMILSQKNVKTGAAVTAGGVDTSHLLRPNLPALPQTNFGGGTYDLNYPINTDLFRVYMDKVVKLTGCAAEGVEQLTRYSTRWSYTFKELPASFTYDDGNGDWANNFAPFIAIGYAYCDGTAPDVATTRLVSHVFSSLTYEDV